MTSRLINADCLDALREMEPESVDACVTDPPYGLGFMGKAWDHRATIAFRPETWVEVFRVLKPGVACAAEGFDFIGIEREAEYFAIADRRINGPLFATGAAE